MRRIIALCSVVLMAIVMLGACGGSSAKTGSDSPETKATSGDNGDNGDNGDSDIAALYENADKQKFKLTFVNDSGDETVYAQDGKGNSSFTSGDSKVYATEEGTVSCSTANGKAKCLSLGTSGVNPFFSIYSTGKTYVSALSKYGDNSSETIADRDAECVTFSAKSIADKAPLALSAIASAIKGSWTFCVDKETGVLLKYAIKDADGKETSQFTVTKFGEPEDSDFTPPATPETVPSYSIPSISLPPGVTMPTIPGDG